MSTPTFDWPTDDCPDCGGALPNGRMQLREVPMNPEPPPVEITEDCVCGTPLRLCAACDDARCYSCDPFGTTDCDDISYPPYAEEVSA